MEGLQLPSPLGRVMLARCAEPPRKWLHGRALLSRVSLLAPCPINSQTTSLPNPGYTRITCTLASLLDPPVLAAFAAPGAAAASCGPSPRWHIRVQVSGGKLRLAMPKLSYQQFGVPGRPSRFRGKQVYLVELSTSLDATSRQWKRAAAAFARCDDDMLLVVPASAPLSYHHPSWCVSQCTGLVHEPVAEQAPLRQAPALTSQADAWVWTGRSLRTDAVTAPHWALLHWLGLVGIASASGLAPDAAVDADALASLLADLPSQPCDHVWHQHVAGVVAADSARQAVDAALALAAAAGTWTAVSLHGFSDGFVSWHGREQDDLLAAGNAMHLFCFPDASIWCYLVRSEHDASF